MTEQEMRLHRCCFTGHRPEKLTEQEAIIQEKLDAKIHKTIEDGFTTFISGMARGVDIWAAEILLRLRDDRQPVKLICASPFEGFEKSWTSNWQNRYNRIMQSADLVRFICPAYSRACFQIRNEWMVDHSARVIAVFNGKTGGTKNTIEYAKKYNATIKMLTESI